MTTAAPPTTYIDRAALAGWARAGRHAPDPDAPIIDTSVRAALLTALDTLEAATSAYAAASEALADALTVEDRPRVRLRAEHGFRVADQSVKSLRARLAALTALVESGR